MRRWEREREGRRDSTMARRRRSSARCDLPFVNLRPPLTLLPQLVDQLAEQERLKEEEELFAAYTSIPPSRSLSMPTVPYASTSSTSLRRYASVPSSQIVEDPFEPISDAFEPDLDPFEPTTSASDRSSVLSRGRSIAMSLTSYGTEVSDGERSSKSRKEAKEPLPSGAVVLDLRDPLTDEELFDPVLASGLSPSFSPPLHSLTFVSQTD